ncbi:MAG: adenylosuccinate lyase [Candidatus Hodarchaeales archaeon]|jgi:adenylosuccinate lyase
MIHPLEDRYRTRIANTFEEQSRIDKMVQVELALAKAHFEQGTITEDEYSRLLEGEGKVTVEFVKEIEKDTHHETMALVEAFTRVTGCDKVHIGATSSDILDTTLALQMKEAHEILMIDALKLKNLLIKKADEKKDLICIGRTHGQHALPMTYGMKFALWAYELDECLNPMEKIDFYGKMNGAIGTFASFGEKGYEIQNLVMKQLGLRTPLITNQVVSRVFIAQYLFGLISVVSLIEKIAKEIRNLQRSEIQEVAEAFSKEQTGSSTMGHKKNPISSENLCSLAKRLRTNILPALENISLEHERDMSNSGNERIIIPETFILTHYMILRICKVLRNFVFFEKSIEQNLTMNPEIFMEKSMIELITKEGLGRQEAYQKAKSTFSKSDPSDYIGLSKETVSRVIKKLKNK